MLRKLHVCIIFSRTVRWRSCIKINKESELFHLLIREASLPNPNRSNLCWGAGFRSLEQGGSYGGTFLLTLSTLHDWHLSRTSLVLALADEWVVDGVTTMHWSRGRMLLRLRLSVVHLSRGPLSLFLCM